MAATKKATTTTTTTKAAAAKAPAKASKAPATKAQPKQAVVRVLQKPEPKKETAKKSTPAKETPTKATAETSKAVTAAFKVAKDALLSEPERGGYRPQIARAYVLASSTKAREAVIEEYSAGWVRRALREEAVRWIPFEGGEPITEAFFTLRDAIKVTRVATAADEAV